MFAWINLERKSTERERKKSMNFFQIKLAELI